MKCGEKSEWEKKRIIKSPFAVLPSHSHCSLVYTFTHPHTLYPHLFADRIIFCVCPRKKKWKKENTFYHFFFSFHFLPPFCCFSPHFHTQSSRWKKNESKKNYMKKIQKIENKRMCVCVSVSGSLLLYFSRSMKMKLKKMRRKEKEREREIYVFMIWCCCCVWCVVSCKTPKWIS